MKTPTVPCFSQELSGTIRTSGLVAPVSMSRIGPYRLGRALARGASGIVYEAEHVEQGRKVAVKVLDQNALDLGPNSRQDALFGREAMILANLPRHPGIIGVLDAGITNGLPYIVTEYVDGQTLSEWIRVRRSEVRANVRVLRDVARAVHHAHENGILHRNLKPSNVLVDASGRAYVTDFGSARREGPSHGQTSMLFSKNLVGSPSYMSPEQAAGSKTVDRRTDVYSLGAILYEVLAGRPPFIATGALTDLVAIIRGAVVPPSQASSEWASSREDKAIESICLQALAKTPETRLPSAQAFADALSRWLGEAPAKEPRRRKPWFWKLGLGVLGGLATLGAILGLLYSEG